MNWLSIPFDNKEYMNKIKKEYSCEWIPKLIYISNTNGVTLKFSKLFKKI
jgi:hypothetical protein